jgi:hypothetical protein
MFHRRRGPRQAQPACRSSSAKAAPPRNFEALIGTAQRLSQPDDVLQRRQTPRLASSPAISTASAPAPSRKASMFQGARAACINPVLHYNLEPACSVPATAPTFIVVEDLRNFRVLQTYIRGMARRRNGVPISPQHTLVTEPASPPPRRPAPRTRSINSTAIPYPRRLRLSAQQMG